MRTKELKVNGKSETCVLICGGPGFKVYSAVSVAGWLVWTPKKLLIVEASNAEFQTVAKYVMIHYQPAAQKPGINAAFERLLKQQESI